MAANTSNSDLNARIVYWGVEGAGKSTCVATIHARLRADHRGDLKRVPTRLDPTISYEELPIAIGSPKGASTQLQIIAVPGHAEHTHTRKQLIDEVDGLVLVLDAQADRLDANIESIEELRVSLADYGRTLEEIPFVVQYNKRDIGDPYAIEELHRRCRFGNAPVFETVASEGTGILQALTTISKQVIRSLRSPESQVVAKPQPAPVETPVATPTPLEAPEPMANNIVRELDDAELVAEPLASAHEVMEAAIITEAESASDRVEIDAAAARAEVAFDRPWAEIASDKPEDGARLGADLEVVSVGTAEKIGARSVTLPLVLGNAEGETVTVALTIALDPLLDGDPL